MTNFNEGVGITALQQGNLEKLPQAQGPKHDTWLFPLIYTSAMPRPGWSSGINLIFSSNWG